MSLTGKKTVWMEVRCDIHGTVPVNKDQPMLRIVKVTGKGTGNPRGCPVVGCPNNPNSKTDERYL